MKTVGKIFSESLSHFSCGYCRKWWAIGDMSQKKTKWHCPWCGKLQTFKKHKKK